MTQQSGQAAEENALAYLQKQGLQLVIRNYSCRLGEIDLVMRDGQYWVFVEVRFRSTPRFGGAIGSITLAKRLKILNTATHYMVKNKLLDRHPMRFDVVCIDGHSAMVVWLKDAFGKDY